MEQPFAVAARPGDSLPLVRTHTWVRADASDGSFSTSKLNGPTKRWS